MNVRADENCIINIHIINNHDNDISHEKLLFFSVKAHENWCHRNNINQKNLHLNGD
jgi:hypothetical protein